MVETSDEVSDAADETASDAAVSERGATVATPPITRPAAAPAATPDRPAPAATPDEPRPLTRPIAIPDVQVAELGVADRLGLGEFDDDDEVGPTS